MRKIDFSYYLKWLTPGLGIKRWLLVALAGMTLLGIGIAQIIVDVYRYEPLPDALYVLMLRPLPIGVRILIGAWSRVGEHRAI